MISGIILTLIVFGFCLVFYRLRHKKKSGFLNYIGIYGTNTKSVLYAIFIAVLAYACSMLVLAHFGLQQLILNPNTPAWSLRSNGFTLTEILKIFSFACIGTALWEELFFRGFLAKRLISFFGFIIGNIAQAVIFGLVHIAVFFLVKLNIELSAYLCIFLIPTFLAYGMAYLNERVAKGSILPGYISHALLNILTPITAALFF